MTAVDFLIANAVSIGALVTACVALLGVYLQRRRDAANEIIQRIDAASKIVKAAVDLTSPLEHRVQVLETDNTVLKDIVKRQSDSYDTLMEKYDKVLYELRAVKADRDNLLAERILYQKRIEEYQSQISKQSEIVAGLEKRVAELEHELSRLQEVAAKT